MQKRIISLIIFFSIIFFFAIAFNISPFLRGPGEYIPDWRWPYYFVNTISKIWAPLLLITILFGFIKKFDKNDAQIKNKEKKLITFLIIWAYLFIFSVLYFSRSGIFVLVERIVNPGENGQFTASLGITNIFSYLSNFNHIVSALEQHAKSHPPGGIVLFWFLNLIFQFFPKENFISNLVLHGSDFAMLWNGLLAGQKLTAVFSSILLPFLLTLPIIPIYYLGKLLFKAKTAFRSIAIYAVVPSVVFFVPLLDAFYSVFPLVSLILVIQGITKRNLGFLFLSGMVMGLGLFFTFSITPYFLIYLITLIILLYQKQNLINLSGRVFKYYTALLLGLSSFLILCLFFLRINLMETVFSIKLVYRSYFPWVFYNLYDFFIFTGIPVFILFVYLVKDFINKFLNYKAIKQNFLFLAFIITLITVDVLGVVRGETGRIYLFFVPILVLLVAHFLTDKIKFNTKFFMIFMLIQLMQVLVMQEFWVMLW